jgi:putative tryptophan/tyrosine transport system ATP-binding protein
MTLLHLDNVILKLAGHSKPILNQINYQVHQDDFIVLLGSNGSGKSSLLKLLYREHQPDSGFIHFLGKPISYHDAKKFSQHVAVLTQHCSDSLFMSLTIYENYLLIKQQSFLSVTRHQDERHFLREYLCDFNVNLADKVDLTIYQLSGGEKQALALALCLLNPPTLLLLDEHTSALDPKTSEQIMQLTQKMISLHRITCILTTHDLDIALRYGNRILMLNQGEIKITFDKEEKCLLSKEILVGHYY